MENVKRLTEEKTCIIVSNRISDIKNTNKIIVLDRGDIVEAGSHDELLENRGLYYKFFIQQSTKSEDSILA